MVGTAIALAAVAFTFFYAPGPPTYTLTHDSLTIHDKVFYSVTLMADAVDAGKQAYHDAVAQTPAEGVL